MAYADKSYSITSDDGRDFQIGTLSGLPTIPSNATLDSVVLTFNAKRSSGATGSSGKVSVVVCGNTIDVITGMERDKSYPGTLNLTSYIKNNNGTLSYTDGTTSIALRCYHSISILGTSWWEISSVKIIANYTIPTYTLTTSVSPAGAGTLTGTTSASYPAGSEIKIYATPSTGYRLKEWTIASDGKSDTVPAEGDYATEMKGTLQGNGTITAVFEKLKYTVTWKNGGTVLETDTNVEYGTTPTYNGSTPTKASTAQYSYTFKGWSPSVGAITGDTTYTAQFTETVRKYSVNFKNQDGSVVKTLANVAYGSTLGTLPTVSRSGYTFAGWMPCAPVKKSDGTVLDSYRYPGDKNSNIPAAYPLDKQYKNYTDKLSVHIEAYMSNWTDIKNRQIISCTEEGGWGFGYQANSKVDGAESHGFEVHTGSGYTGYDLKFGTSGVYSDNEWYSFDIVFSNGVIEIFVDGVSKGRRTASGTTIYHKYADNTIFVGAEAAKDATTPNGNYFKGFISNVFIANQGARLVAATESTVVEGNVDYYPVWRLIPTYTATFKNHDGTVLQEGTVEHGTTPGYNGSTPTKPSTAQYTYVFSGWSPTVGPITGDTTYTAQFTERVRQYTVTASGENGTVTGDIGTYDYWTSITLTATPNPGYEFVEWIVNGEPNSLYQNPLFTVVNQNLNIVAVFRRNGIYAGTSRAKAIYVGTTPVKAIYVGTTKVYEQ